MTSASARRRPGLALISAAHVGILLTPNLFLRAWGGASASEVLSRVALSTLLLVGLLGLARRTWLAILVLLPFYLAVPFEVEYLRSFGELPSLAMIASVFETDLSEASELLSGFPVAVAVAVGLVAANLALALAAHRSGPAPLTVPTRLFALGGLVALFALLEPGLKDAFPYRTVDTIEKYAREKTRIYRHLYATRSYRFDARDESGVARQVHVLVIGESSRASNWGLYGYARDTTPRLAREPGLVVFRDATAMSSYTRMAVPGIITRVRADTYTQLAHGEKSVLDAFGEAGYRTWWLSNQKRLGKNDTLATALASRADEIRFVNIGYESKLQVDGRLLAPFARALASPAAKKFIVVHMRGSHWSYGRRYPAEFDRFRPSLDPDLEHRIDDPSIRAEILNSYDNSILYTDHLLAELVTMLRGAGGVATLTYVADHGENLHDDERGLFGHGSTSRFELDVPIVVWVSDAWAARFREGWDALLANRERRVSHDHVFFTVLDLARIVHRFSDPRESVASPAFAERERLFLTGSLEVVSTARVAAER